MFASKVALQVVKRRHIIKELVDTEHSFGQDMKVVDDIYRGTSNVIIISAEDVKTLFSNSEQIVAFSTSFLDALKQASKSVYVLAKSFLTVRILSAYKALEPKIKSLWCSSQNWIECGGQYFWASFQCHEIHQRSFSIANSASRSFHCGKSRSRRGGTC